MPRIIFFAPSCVDNSVSSFYPLPIARRLYPKTRVQDAGRIVAGRIRRPQNTANKLRRRRKFWTDETGGEEEEIGK